MKQKSHWMSTRVLDLFGLLSHSNRSLRMQPPLIVSSLFQLACSAGVLRGRGLEFKTRVKTGNAKGDKQKTIGRCQTTVCAPCHNNQTVPPRREFPKQTMTAGRRCFLSPPPLFPFIPFPFFPWFPLPCPFFHSPQPSNHSMEHSALARPKYTSCGLKQHSSFNFPFFSSSRREKKKNININNK